MIDFMKNLNQSFNNNVETLIINDYKSYLKKYENAVRKLAENNIYQYFKNNENNIIDIESNSSRFIYFQYMLYLQTAISKKLNAKPNFKIDPSNDGGKNVIPSVAFWREAGNSYKGLISSAYAGIDGSTFK